MAGDKKGDGKGRSNSTDKLAAEQARVAAHFQQGLQQQGFRPGEVGVGVGVGLPTSSVPSVPLPSSSPSTTPSTTPGPILLISADGESFTIEAFHLLAAR